jgi:hypothetical protein
MCHCPDIGAPELGYTRCPCTKSRLGVALRITECTIWDDEPCYVLQYAVRHSPMDVRLDCRGGYPEAGGDGGRESVKAWLGLAGSRRLTLVALGS